MKNIKNQQKYKNSIWQKQKKNLNKKFNFYIMKKLEEIVLDESTMSKNKLENMN